jgi:hypothetical protein
MKMCPVGPELFHGDGQTDGHMMTLIVTFHNFVNAPNKKFQYWGMWRYVFGRIFESSGLS